jgi:hypothetical protein
MKMQIAEEGQCLHISPDSHAEREIIMWFIQQQQEREIDLGLIGRPMSVIQTAEEVGKAQPFVRICLGKYLPKAG